MEKKLNPRTRRERGAGKRKNSFPPCNKVSPRRARTAGSDGCTSSPEPNTPRSTTTCAPRTTAFGRSPPSARRTRRRRRARRKSSFGRAVKASLCLLLQAGRRESGPPCPRYPRSRRARPRPPASYTGPARAGLPGRRGEHAFTSRSRAPFLSLVPVPLDPAPNLPQHHWHSSTTTTTTNPAFMINDKGHSVGCRVQGVGFRVQRQGFTV